jgi:hypothetical protein
MNSAFYAPITMFNTMALAILNAQLKCTQQEASASNAHHLVIIALMLIPVLLALMTRFCLSEVHSVLLETFVLLAII